MGEALEYQQAALRTLRAPQHPDRLVAFLWLMTQRESDEGPGYVRDRLVDEATEINLAEVPSLPGPDEPPPSDLDERIRLYQAHRALSGATPMALNAIAGLPPEAAPFVERVARKAVEGVADQEAQARQGVTALGAGEEGIIFAGPAPKVPEE